jgi:hypothetical protein
MAIDKAELLAALKSLNADELAAAGLTRTAPTATAAERPREHPFRASAATPDRVRRIVPRGDGTGDERWYQLEVGDYVAELHLVPGPGGEQATLHRYVRRHEPAVREYLLDGCEHYDSLVFPEMAGADEPSIWAQLERSAGGGRRSAEATGR